MATQGEFLASGIRATKAQLAPYCARFLSICSKHRDRREILVLGLRLDETLDIRTHRQRVHILVDHHE